MNARVLLIDCSRPLDPQDRLVYDTHHPPLGLLSLATYIRSSDLGSKTTIQLLDSTVDYTSMEELKHRIKDFEPDIVGLRCLHYHSKQLHAITEYAKTLSKKPIVIAGGPYVSGAMEHAFKRDRHIDFICVGEGELTFHDAVSAYLSSRDLRSVPGLHYYEDGAVRSAPERALIQDLDTLPYPDWSTINLRKYESLLGQAPILRRQAPLETSRGCPYRCTYCHELFQKTFRVRSPEHVVSELELLHSLGVHDVSIIDDIFNLYPERVIKIFDLIAKKNLKMRFYYPNGLRGDRMTHEAIDAMVGGGSVLFTYALESGSKRIQKFMKKNLRFAEFADAVQYTIGKGVMVDAFLMAGFPTETFEEAQSTIDFIKQFDVICMPYLNVLNAFPGTEMFDWLAEKMRAAGSELTVKDEEAYTGYSMSTLPKGLDVDAISDAELRALKINLLGEYVLVRPRLEKALAIQQKFLTQDELLRKYQSYFPGLQSIDALRGMCRNSDWNPNAFRTAEVPRRRMAATAESSPA